MPPYQLTLEVGVIYEHHWLSNVAAFEIERFIEFGNRSWLGGCMRIELSPLVGGTGLGFLAFGKKLPRPSGSWHGGLDALGQ